MRNFLLVSAAAFAVVFATVRIVDAGGFGNLVVETPSGARVRAPNPTTTQVWIADTTAPLGGAFKTFSGDATLAATGALTLGTVSVGKGGTGATTLTDHGVLVGSGTGAITPLAVCTNGQLVVGSSAADPACQTMSGDATLASNGALTLATVGVTKGGTGLTTMTDHGFLLGSGTGAVTPMAVCTDGQLAVGQSTADPACQTIGGDATLAANGTLTLGTVPVAKGGTGATTLPACTTNQALRYDGTTWTALGTVASVTGTAPVTSSGGATPAISMAAATADANGYLASSDWATFNAKQAAGAYLTECTADAPITGTGTAASHLILAVATADANGYLSSADWGTFNGKQAAGSYLTAVTADAPLSGSGTSGSHLLMSVATADAHGYLSSADWTTFNNKQAAGAVTSVTGDAPVASSGGATPAISMAAATTSVNGYLTSTDWTTFNSKQAAGAYLTECTADAPITGAGTSGSHLAMAASSASVNGYLSSTDWSTFNGKQASGSYVTSVTGTAPVASSGGTTPAISLPVATADAHGYLSSADWTTFNNKQAAGAVTSVTGTSPVASSGGATPAISLPVATADAHGYLSSADFGTFNAKQALLGDCATIDSATDLDTALTAIGQIKTCIETTWGK